MNCPYKSTITFWRGPASRWPPACRQAGTPANRKKLGFYVFVFFYFAQVVWASEVIPESASQVVVREHPRTGKPLVCITAGEKGSAPALFNRQARKMTRPDYRMLQPGVKPGDVGYDGPVSSRKKVYALAATLAAGGVAGYALIPAAAASGGADGGAGAYALAGGTVATGTISGALSAGHSDKPDDFTHKSQSVFLEPADKG